jgi:protein-disulfide isomerase
VGLLYFGGGLLTLLLFHTKPVVLYPLLYGMTLAALPYTFWSIHYQWRRARRWCVLCLAVQATLWLEFVTLLYFQHAPSWPKGISKPEVVLFLTGFALVSASWALLKPILHKAARADSLHHRLQLLKFDPLHLESLRQRSRPLPALLAGMQVPTLGPADAPHKFLVVTNPTCSVCARVHVEIEDLVTELDDVCCQFIIAVSPVPGDVSATVAEHLLHQPIDKVPSALHEWYTTLNLKRWLKKTPLLERAPSDHGERQVALHQQWCAQAGVNATPVIFFNGVEIPRYYTTGETKRVIRFLISRHLQAV